MLLHPPPVGDTAIVWRFSPPRHVLARCPATCSQASLPVSAYSLLRCFLLHRHRRAEYKSTGMGEARGCRVIAYQRRTACWAPGPVPGNSLTLLRKPRRCSLQDNLKPGRSHLPQLVSSSPKLSVLCPRQPRPYGQRPEKQK